MRHKKIRVKDIARRLGISPATVSQALNHPEQVNRSTRRQVLSMCEDLGYIKPQKHKRRTFNLAVVSGDAHNFTHDFYADVCEQLLYESKKLGYNLIFEPWDEAEDDFPVSISKNKVDGVISLGGIGQDKIILIKQKHLPIVLCGHPLPDLEIHTVLPDGRSGVHQICRYLISLGHKRIAMITGGREFDQVSRDRAEGYLFALAEAGIKLGNEYIVQGDFINYQKVATAINKLLSFEKRPTAIVCASDPIAYSVYDQLTRKGIKVPEDISVTGFDNLKPPKYTAGIVPKLTTVNVDTKELAGYTLKIIFEIMKEKKKIAWRYTLPVTIDIGQTTAKPSY